LEKPPVIHHVGSETAPVEPTVAPPAESPRELAPERRSAWADRLIPIAVASALFMEFIDSTALSTALPTLARAFHSDPVHLKLALTSYLFALAVFAPGSGWVADRFGARRVFLCAMGVFLFGSALCGFSHSLQQLVGARIVQGIGGAMMTPVGRLIVVNSAPRDRFVSAMSWFTMPALVGPLVGPPLSGLVLAVADWPWIFFINIPVGIIGAAAVLRFVPPFKGPAPGRFDTLGFLLSAAAITSIVFVADTAGVGLVSPWLVGAVTIVGVLALAAFIRHALRAEKPVLNLRLLGIRTYRASLLGGSLVRLGIGATPLLLPLLLQIGLGWTPIQSGGVTIAQTVGALSCKPAAPALIRRFGFRLILLGSIAAACVTTALPGAFRATTPIWLMIAALGVGGFARSLQFTSANTIAYADIPRAQVSQASTLSTVVQQVGMSIGVSFGGLMLHIARGHGGAALTPDRFTFPFIMIGVMTLLAAPVYWALDRNAGAVISGRAVDKAPGNPLTP
jgi:EmrB/QacA subfamily drug resistance transporter